MSNIEKTLSIVKPDAVERNLDNEIKQMFNKGESPVVNCPVCIDECPCIEAECVCTTTCKCDNCVS